MIEATLQKQIATMTQQHQTSLHQLEATRLAAQPPIDNIIPLTWRSS